MKSVSFIWKVTYFETRFSFTSVIPSLPEQSSFSTTKMMARDSTQLAGSDWSHL
jgi:hypothetical protein